MDDGTDGSDPLTKVMAKTSTREVRIARSNDGAFNGVIDEIRVSNTGVRQIYGHRIKHKPYTARNLPNEY